MLKRTDIAQGAKITNQGRTQSRDQSKSHDKKVKMTKKTKRGRIWKQRIAARVCPTHTQKSIYYIYVSIIIIAYYSVSIDDSSRGDENILPISTFNLLLSSVFALR